jgi:hypothetical protein
MPNGAKPESGNWVLPNELGNELGNNERKTRKLIDTLGFKVCDFSTSVSKTGSGDLWMSYVLDKSGRGDGD